MLIGYQRYLPEIFTSSDVWVITCMLLGISSIVLIEANNQSMRKFGLIGFPLTLLFRVLFSRKNFQRRDQWLSIPKPPTSRHKNSKIIARKRKLSGFNVTIPHKENYSIFR